MTREEENCGKRKRLVYWKANRRLRAREDGCRVYTLIFNGSPRRAGDTSALIQVFCREIRGQVEQIDAYRSTLSPCVDCRRCAGGGGCVINDGMQEIYEKVEKAQVLVLASPL